MCIGENGSDDLLVHVNVILVPVVASVNDLKLFERVLVLMVLHSFYSWAARTHKLLQVRRECSCMG